MFLSAFISAFMLLQAGSLGSLWTKYDEAVRKDRPEDQISILAKIKKTALSQNEAWDFYDASLKYCSAKGSINWKEYSKEREKMTSEVNDSGIPAMIWYHSRQNGSSKDSLWRQSNRLVLEKSANRKFWENDPMVWSFKFGKALPFVIQNDWEYVRWSSGEMKELQGWEAAALLATDDSLAKEFSRLEAAKTSSEAQYKALAGKCLDLQKQIKSFKGTERRIADCCTECFSILEQLENKSVMAEINGSELSVIFRNTSEAEIKITTREKAPQTIFKTTVKNRDGHYYIRDTVKLSLPYIQDGDYLLCTKAGSNTSEAEYTKHSLSIAYRYCMGHMGVYIADAQSGEPARNAHITLCRANDTVIAEAAVDCSNGFATVPSVIDPLSYPSEKSMYIHAAAVGSSSDTLLSNKIRVWGRSWNSQTSSETEQMSYLVLSDKKAYNQGETVHFKVIAYLKGAERLSAAPQGLPLSAKLLNAKGREVKSISLKTGKNGSAAASLLIPQDAEGGNWQIRITNENGNAVHGHSIRVDQFILPSFELRWNREKDRDYLPGEKISVSGSLLSYTGHNVSTLKCTVRDNAGDEVKADLKRFANGDFEISFASTAQLFNYYTIEVTAVDATGETKSISTAVAASSSVSVSVHQKDRLGDVLWKRELQFTFSLSRIAGLSGEWQLLGKGGVCARGDIPACGSIDLSGLDLAEGSYTLKAHASVVNPAGKELSSDYSLKFYLFNGGSRIEDGLGTLICFNPANKLEFSVGALDKAVFAVAELFSKYGEPLCRKIVKTSGAAAISTVFMDAPQDCSLAGARVHVLFFLNGKFYSKSATLEDSIEDNSLPLQFTRFLDTTLPGASYSFRVKTVAGAECTAVVFDKSSEQIKKNLWSGIAVPSRNEFRISYSNSCGYNKATSGIDEAIPFQQVKIRGMGGSITLMSKANAPQMEQVESVAADSAVEQPQVRSNMASTALWEPFLEADANGEIEFSFTNSDKLSTYVVQLFAFDHSMRNSAIRREMMVTLPVKVSELHAPFLYSSDNYILGAGLSNNSTEAVSGIVTASFFNGKDREALLLSRSEEVSVPAMASLRVPFEIEVPAIDTLGILISFRPQGCTVGGDAVFVCTPVRKPAQTITEAHSALVTSESELDGIMQSLRGLFVNTSADQVVSNTICMKELVEKVLLSYTASTYEDALSLSSAIKADRTIRSAGMEGLPPTRIEDLKAKLLACRNQDGGFAWFAGMKSSPAVSALILERFPEDSTLAKTAAYLDAHANELGFELYAHARAQHSSTRFSTGGLSKAELKILKKSAKAYLTPGKQVGLRGSILGKARRIQTCEYLLSSEEGKALAKAWGVKLGTLAKLELKKASDLASLRQYAVSHPNGGIYFPNLNYS